MSRRSEKKQAKFEKAKKGQDAFLRRKFPGYLSDEEDLSDNGHESIGRRRGKHETRIRK